MYFLFGMGKDVWVKFGVIYRRQALSYSPDMISSFIVTLYISLHVVIIPTYNEFNRYSSNMHNINIRNIQHNYFNILNLLSPFEYLLQ